MIEGAHQVPAGQLMQEMELDEQELEQRKQWLDFHDAAFDIPRSIFELRVEQELDSVFVAGIGYAQRAGFLPDSTVEGDRKILDDDQNRAIVHLVASGSWSRRFSIGFTATSRILHILLVMLAIPASH